MEHGTPSQHLVIRRIFCVRSPPFKYISILRPSTSKMKTAADIRAITQHSLSLNSTETNKQITIKTDLDVAYISNTFVLLYGRYYYTRECVRIHRINKN